MTIYSSLPLQGATRDELARRPEGRDSSPSSSGTARRARARSTYEKLDDSTAQAGQWDAGATSANARKVAGDENAIALIGEFNSGASAISIPITNEAGVLQVSPSNTALELTKDAGPGRQGRSGEVLPDG